MTPGFEELPVAVDREALAATRAELAGRVMTPKERGEICAAGLRVMTLDEADRWHNALRIEGAIQAAVAAEREACAKVLLDMAERYKAHDADGTAGAQGTCHAAANLIRARGDDLRPDDVDYPADHFGDGGRS